MANTTHNIDPKEIEKFNALAARWWDSTSEFKPLHDINPLRLNYIDEQAGIAGKTVLDVGCGGGILAESMALRGADVTAIDMAEAALAVAKLHLIESGAEVNYQQISVEELAEREPSKFDVVTCMEMLEHTPDPSSVIKACGQLVKPGGAIFFSTLNRTPKSYLFAILGAEYILKMLPKGTHDYQKFIRPSELDEWCRSANLKIKKITGMSYNPITKNYKLGKEISVNYLAHVVRPE